MLISLFECIPIYFYRDIFFALMLIASPMARAELFLYVDDVAPYYFRERGEEAGLFYDLLRELSGRVGYLGNIQALPLARELEVVRRFPDAIGVVARMAEREQSYTWICELLDEEVLLISDVKTLVDISSIAAVKNLRVGVLRGSPSESTARKLGFTNIHAVSHAESNAHKLALGRVDVLMSLRSVALYGQKKAGLGVEGLRFGAVVMPFKFYLSASRHMETVDVEKWKVACLTMREDGTHARLLRKYDYPIRK